MAAGNLAGLLLARTAGRTLTRFLQGFVWGIAPTDVSTYAAVTGFFLAIAAAATIVPARRVLRIDPASALRTE